MTQPQTDEKEQILKILSLLEDTYSCNDSAKVKSSQEQLQTLSEDFQLFTSLLYKSLLLSNVNGKQISLDLHKSVVIYLRNILLKKSNDLDPGIIFESLKSIIQLFFSWQNNINLNNNTITIILQNIVSFLLSIKSITDIPKYIESLLSDISKLFLEEKTEYTSESNILITCEKVISLTASLLTSKSINSNNYENLINNYFLPMVDKIFSLGEKYINTQMNIYNESYCLIIKNLYDEFYIIFTYLNSTLKNDKFSQICIEIFKRYWKYSYELIQLCPPLNEENAKIFEKPNPIIALNVKELEYINIMKSRVIQLMSYTIQSICSISNDLDFINQQKENKNNEDDDEDESEDEIFPQKNKSITDKDLASYIINMIKLTVSCFEDLLSNKEKYFLVRNYDMEINSKEKGINIILYELCVFLTRALIRQPFKNTFKKDIKLFLLNVLFPLFSTNETEKNSIDKDFEAYHSYISDITDEFKIKNFRTSGMFLISKICEFYGDERNFILSFSLEMFNYTMNSGNIPNNELNYNVYLENKDKFKLDKLDDETKIDFFLLLMLLLGNQIDKNILIRNHLKKLLIGNQEKLHQIQSLPIKIKICKIYSYFIPLLFKNEQNTNRNNILQKQLEEDANNKNNEIDKNKIVIECKFIQNAIDYLLKNIGQNIVQNNQLAENKNYSQSLSHIAAESLSHLINSFKEEIYDEEDDQDGDNINIKNDYSSVNNYISKTLSDNIKIIINLILIIDNPSFYNLIDYVMEYIKAEDRQDIFLCLKNITEKFIKDFDKEIKDESKPYILQYFKILSSFLKGVNKLNKNDANEIKLFEEILDKIFDIIDIKKLENFEFNDELINTMRDYIQITEFINNKSVIVLKCILPILNKDKTFNSNAFSFLTTFMKYMTKPNNLPKNINMELIEEIIKIIKLSFTFKDEIYDESIKNVLLLTLKIFNMSIMEIPDNTFKELLLLSINSFTPFTKEDLYLDNMTEKSIINQLCLCNISLGFIFRPQDTYKIIFEQNNNSNDDKSKDENNNDNNKKNSHPTLNLYFNLLLTIISIPNNNCIILLYKCIILGLCSMLKENYCKQKINENQNMRLFLLQSFVKLVEKHKKEQVDQLNKLMKRETDCNFIEEEKEEEDEEDEDDDIEEVKNLAQEILDANENIKNADEYRFFSEVIKDIKNNDIEAFKLLNNNFRGKLEELLFVRNVNISYKGKQYNVPRKTVRIVKK